MTVAERMLDVSPKDLGKVDTDKLRACVEACFECAQACTACADACLSEADIAELATCVRANQDCADLCDATGRVLSRFTARDTNLTRAALHACATACKSCGETCELHAGTHAHCRVCAEACHRCEQACLDLASNLD